MKKKCIYILLWTIIFTLFFVLFPNVATIHPHIEYSALLAPLILLTTLIAASSELFDGMFPAALYPGVLFWLVVIAIFLLPIDRFRLVVRGWFGYK
ncbi:hypothetical protein L4C36_18320 [Photobacterium japonica]|uniref:hypothetical protein n=1 Tax=Photobacterium japonica TaxID=2910235 RepID=UPI003D0EF02D